MRHSNKPTLGFVRFAIIVAALAASGCSLLIPQPEPEPPPVPDPADSEPKIVIQPPQPASVPKPSVKVPEPPVLPPVAIILTSSQPAYADIARELTLSLDNYEVYDLSDDVRPPVTVLRLINDSDTGAVVAIGLRAAVSSVAMSKKPVVFSQVFNYQDHDLLTENSRGVAAIVPLDAQIAAWKEFDPSISRIGAVIGEGHDDLIAEAELAAERHGIELQIHITHSDQETLYFFKRMVRDIDGFWLFPDNRVLSRRALQEIMDGAQRHHVAVLVQNESMLSIGASISVSSVAADIADRITKIVRQIEAGKLAMVPLVSPLSEIRVKTNDTIQVVDR